MRQEPGAGEMGVKGAERLSLRAWVGLGGTQWQGQLNLRKLQRSSGWRHQCRGHHTDVLKDTRLGEIGKGLEQ